jgi:hypothetical protein
MQTELYARRVTYNVLDSSSHPDRLPMADKTHTRGLHAVDRGLKADADSINSMSD